MRYLWICLCGVLLMANVQAAEEAKDTNALPADLSAILEKAESLTLFSLHPERADEKENEKSFHGYPVHGSVELKDKVKTEAVTAVLKGIADSTGIVANCFMPRHGLRATLNGKTVDLLICYQCAQIVVYTDTAPGAKPAKGLTTDGAPAELLNKQLTEAKIRFEKP